MSNAGKSFGMGWLRDYPDFRDYTIEHEEINKLLKPARVLASI
jgi:hypothetical protein